MLRQLIVVVALLALADRADAARNVLAKDSEIVETQLATLCKRLGFTVTVQPDRPSTIAWENARFGMSKKSFILLKSVFPSGLGKDHFYRFKIWEESFPDSIFARTRLDSMAVMPPRLGVEGEYVYGLQRSYQVRNRVVSIQTDVFAYMAKAEQMAKSLRRLEDIPEGGNKVRILDSIAKALRKPSE